MPLSEKIKKKIADFSKEDEQDEIFTLLEEKLQEKSVSAKDVLDYARSYSFTKSKRYVIAAGTINQLGVVVAKLPDAKQSQLAIEFYKLAAERESGWGCLNFGKRLLRQQLVEQALIYAGKAVDYADLNDEKLLQNAYYLQGQCYEALGRFGEAMVAYSHIKDKNLSFYAEVIAKRAALLKKQIANDLADVKASADEKVISDNKLSDDSEVAEVTQALASADISDVVISMSSEVKVAAVASRMPDVKWTAETSWFHSVDRSKFDNDLAKLKHSISMAKNELEIIDAMLEADDSALPEKVKAELIAKKEALEKKLADLKEDQEKHITQSEKYLPEYRQTHRRYCAEIRFFDPKRSNKAHIIRDLTGHIIDHRYQQNAVGPIDLNGRSSRQVISAERCFQEAVIALTNDDSPKLGIPIARRQPWDFGYISGSNNFGPTEEYKVGDTTINVEHRENPKRDRLGDSFLPDGGSYDGKIYPFLQKLTKDNPEHEKQLAHYMIRYGRTHQTVSLAELKSIYDEADAKDVEHFNQICFLVMEKEQSQWHSAIDKRCHLGMTVAQARCLILLEAGMLSFAEVFQNNVLFGVYSRKDILRNLGVMSKTCKYIDDLYLAYLQKEQTKAKDHHTFLKKYITQTSAPTMVLTREQAHRDLKQVYGGESDTDDEGYESDISLYESPRAHR